MFRTTAFVCTLLLSVALIFPSHSYSDTAEPAFISDALFVYVHSGPSNQFRIIGTVNAGDSIQLLDRDADSGYVQIQFEGNRRGWLPGQYVSTSPGMAVQLQQLNEQLAEHQSTLDELQQQNQQLNRELSARTEEYNRMREQLQVANTAYEQLKMQFDAEHSSVWQNPKVLGAAILGFGLLLGLLLPLLMPRRKNSERWM
ncbi:TIGR04211 family SH3 domain-containing protein [Alkalimonas sp. MEB108]|uniref:TIGR04211 family SH3 domain-containing protein n=1 Tax=Alkalimonas cellulosilytica TaxID=3058395 RepID=A0ABU7J7S2_9GAMM|nr:TIGR04211 family SH3 domain-containing protein [Alkalimonas sp. MEB108]MEE2002449.1 TIGR04211 family SH3 domain-containing protein [Alkalimonas sp. MEB108]